MAFVEQGPRTLEELTMSSEEETFSSFDAFKKIDLMEEAALDKRFGEAGDGYEYHHIVEQSSGLSEAELNATSNIVRIPKLLHEEVNAELARLGGDGRERQAESGARLFRGTSCGRLGDHAQSWDSLSMKDLHSPDLGETVDRFVHGAKTMLVGRFLDVEPLFKTNLCSRKV